MKRLLVAQDCRHAFGIEAPPSAPVRVPLST
jgi:hypothetical protein